MKNIIVLGAGFGGLRAAKQIAKKLKRLELDKRYGVILIDKNNHHTYTPLLYEIATTSKTTANICELHKIAAYDIKPLLSGLPIKFLENKITKIDAENGYVCFEKNEKLLCDYIVVALGSETNYFGIRGLKENSLPLKEFVDAVRIRDRIWNLAMEKQSNIPISQYPNINVIIGGGGSTGVELAGELKTWCGELETEFSRCALDVKIVEAGPSVLSGFPGKVVKRIEGRLKKLNVDIVSGKRIAEATKKDVILDDGKKLPFDVFIWSGGVKAPELLTGMPLKSEPKGRIVVENRMNVCVSEDAHLHIKPKIYGVGDGMCFYNPLTGHPVPGVARAAISQANVAAHNLMEDIKTNELGVKGQGSREYKPKYKTYKPMDYPYIIPVGGKWALAKIGPFIISGFFGWILKGLVELNYLISIMSFWRAVKIWLKGLKIFIKNDRLG